MSKGLGNPWNGFHHPKLKQCEPQQWKLSENIVNILKIDHPDVRKPVPFLENWKMWGNQAITCLTWTVPMGNQIVDERCLLIKWGKSDNIVCSPCWVDGCFSNGC